MSALVARALIQGIEATELAYVPMWEDASHLPNERTLRRSHTARPTATSRDNLVERAYRFGLYVGRRIHKLQPMATSFCVRELVVELPGEGAMTVNVTVGF